MSDPVTGAQFMFFEVIVCWGFIAIVIALAWIGGKLK